MIRTIFIFLFSIGLFSCESPVELDMDYYEPSLSISGLYTSTQAIPTSLGLFGRDNNFKIQVTQSRPVSSDEDFAMVSDATLELYSDKELLETLTYDSNTKSYIGETQAEEGISYLLKVNHPDFEPILSESSVPIHSSIGSTTPVSKTGDEPSAFIPNRNIERVQMEIELEDSLDENYYHVLFYANIVDYHLSEFADTIIHDNTRNDLYIANFDLGGQNEEGAIISNNSIELYGAYLTDKDFKESPKKLNFTLQYLINPAQQLADNIIVEVRTISKEYYDFHTSAIQNANTGSNPFSNPAVSINSNIQNGHGIFSGYSYDIKVIKL